MEEGFLSQYFQGVAVKRLRLVEANQQRSHQHEFNGSRPLRNLLGNNQINDYPARFLWLGGEDSLVTWYDSRANNPRRASEFRLYFKDNPVMEAADEGDLLVVAKRPNKDLFIIVARTGTSFEAQLLWLFGMSEQVGFGFEFHRFENEKDVELDFAARYILDELGIEIHELDAERLDTLIERFGTVFPTTQEFSLYARTTLPFVYPMDDPDHALMAWMEHEEKMFRRLERRIVDQRLNSGFVGEDGSDVDGFLKFSLSVQNRRKSRVGYALENHTAELFNAYGLSFSWGKETENKAKPDFIFPSIDQYHDPDFPKEKLSMLGVKSTCKDRWRQVLSEAARIEVKHLLTLEPGISENQTDEMRAHSLQLILPSGLHQTYKSSQQTRLMSVASFLQMIRERQRG